jgi:citrate lyase subunit beta/citryl-CoA lyase
MIATFDEAKAAGKGVVTFNGRMVEELHVRDAKRILSIADAVATR